MALVTIAFSNTALSAPSSSLCAEAGNLSSHFATASVSNCTVSVSCQNVENALLQAEIDAREAYRKLCEARAKEEQLEKQRKCEKNCHENMAKADKIFDQQLSQLLNELLRIRKNVEAAKNAAYQEADRQAKKFRLIRLDKMRDHQELSASLDKLLGFLEGVFVQNAYAAHEGGICVTPQGVYYSDAADRTVAFASDHTQDACPRGLEYRRMRKEDLKNGPEARALRAIRSPGNDSASKPNDARGSGSTISEQSNPLSPSLLKSMRPEIGEPLLAASEAKKVENSLNAKIANIEQEIVALKKHRNLANDVGSRLASTAYSGNEKKSIGFSAPSVSLDGLKEKKATVKKESSLKNQKIEKVVFKEPQSPSKHVHEENKLEVDASHTAVREVLLLGKSDLVRDTSGLSSSAEPLNPSSSEKSKKDAIQEKKKLLKNSLREKLLRDLARLNAKGKSLSKKDAQTLAMLEAENEEEPISEKSEGEESVEEKIRNFTLAGSETDAEIRQMKSEIDVREAGIQGIDSPSLFVRVHEGYLRLKGSLE